MRRLWLNGQVADMGEAPTFQYKSNAMGTLDNIEFNRSFTLHLPMSLRNASIFRSAQRVDVTNAVTRQWLTCDYELDGILIVEGGMAKVTKADADGYDITIIWGVIEPLKAMKDDDKRITELSGTPSVKLLTNRGGYGGDPDDPDTGIIYAGYESGMSRAVTGVPYLLPVVRATWILDKIESEYSISFAWGAGIRSILETFGIALTTRKNFTVWRTLWCDQQGSIALELTWVNPDQGGAAGWYILDPTQYQVLTLADGMARVPRSTATIGGIVTHLTWTDSHDDTVYYLYRNIYAEEKTKMRSSSAYSWVDSNGDAVLPYTDDIYQVYNLEENDHLFFTSLPNGSAVRDTTVLAFNYLTDEDVRIGQQYPILNNLPDMSCFDFVAECCWRLALYPIYTGSSTAITFVSVGDVLAKTPQQITLLDSSVEPSYEGMCQHNLLRHTTDEEQPYDGAGDITVSDLTLDATRDWFTSKLVLMGERSIPIYDVHRDNGTVIATDNEIKPRIGKIINNSDVNWVLRQEGMDFASLISTYWGGWQGIVSSPTLVSGKVHLRPWEVAALDFTRPVYDTTTQQNYLVRSVTTGESDICEIQLIKI